MIPDYDAVVIDEAHELVVAGHPGRHRRAARPPTSTGRPGVPSGTSRAPRPTTSPTRPTRCADAIAAASTRPHRLRARRSSATRWCWSATRPAPASRRTPRTSDCRRGRRRPHPGPGSVQEVFVDRRADGRRHRGRRALAGRGRRPDPAAAVRRAARRSGARCATSCSPTRPSVFTSATLMLGGDFSAVATSVGLKPSERVDRRRDGADDDEDALPWRGLDVGVAVRLRPAGDPLRRPAPAAARPRRPGQGPARRDRRAGRRRARAARSGCSLSRRAAETAAEEVRERLPHLTTLAQGDAQLPELAKQFVEDPHTCLFGTCSPVAGPRRPGRHLPAGAHRPDPVPAPRRPADERPPARRRQGRRQRLHAGRRHPRRAAAGPGLGPADPHDHRPRRRRRARPAAGDRPLRRRSSRPACRRCGPPPTRRWSARR